MKFSFSLDPVEELKDLVLHVKAEYFYQMQSGEKHYEYRLDNERWQKRLEGRKYKNLIICLGYPKKDDTSRRLVFPYCGYIRRTITHEHFGDKPVIVFAILIDHNRRIQ
jgi:hypothetical protein